MTYGAMKSARHELMLMYLLRLADALAKMGAGKSSSSRLLNLGCSFRQITLSF